MLKPGIVRTEAIDNGINQSCQCFMVDLDGARLAQREVDNCCAPKEWIQA